MAFGQTRQINAPSATTCKGASASVSSYTPTAPPITCYWTSRPSGNMCAGTWNSNSGGGIPDYTICNPPSRCQHRRTALWDGFISASANSVTSNPVEVYVHAPVSSVTLATSGIVSGAQQCYSQGASTQLDSEACFASEASNTSSALHPRSRTIRCPGGLPPGVTSVPSCSNSIGALTYAVGTASIATLNSATQHHYRTATGNDGDHGLCSRFRILSGLLHYLPTEIHLGHAEWRHQRNGDAGHYAEPATTVIDTNNQTITGLTLDYQSTNPLDIAVASTGAVAPSFPGAASVYAICQPRPAIHLPSIKWVCYGTGLSISSNPVDHHDAGNGKRLCMVFFSRTVAVFRSHRSVDRDRWARLCACRTCRIRW